MISKKASRPVAGLALGLSALIFGSFSAASPAPKLVEKAPQEAKLVALGKALFYDKTLSNPAGMACVSCHDPSTGYSYPVSFTNSYFGIVPGVVKGRAGNRRPPSAAYAPFMAKGLPHFDNAAQAWVGGLFWDGRAINALAQAKQPFMNPNEMNNTDHGVGSPEMVIKKIKTGPTGLMFKEVYGAKVFDRPTAEVYDLVAKAIVAFEASPEVSPFTSKYDAYLEGKAEFTPEELLGLRLATGFMRGRSNSIPFKKSAHCMDCHAISDDPAKTKDLWTNSCYANLGVPANPRNPFYGLTDAKGNPAGYNKDGSGWVDLGLAGFIYPYYKWAPRTLNGPDPLRIMSTFKAPTLRNVDKRPYPGFVKSYMHNGVFKSLKEVVHFYNSRNLTTVPGEVIDFTAPDPYANLKGTPLFAHPEYPNPNSLINPTGMATGPGSRTTGSLAPSPTGDLDAMQIGNLMLTEEQEDAIVAFLKTLSDGYFVREPAAKPKAKAL